MVSLDVCLLCDDDGESSAADVVGSCEGLSTSCDLEATFCTAVSGCNGVKNMQDGGLRQAPYSVRTCA